MRTLDWKDYNNAEEFIAKLMVKKANLEQENKKMENKILKLWKRIYQNIDGEKRKEYQEYCKRHKL